MFTFRIKVGSLLMRKENGITVMNEPCENKKWLDVWSRQVIGDYLVKCCWLYVLLLLTRYTSVIFLPDLV